MCALLNTSDPALILLAGLAALAVLSTYPFVATAIEYRHRDNGLAYLLMVMGVGVWNGLFAAQLVAPTATAAGFFLALSLVGALLAGLGWFLFAGTASSTPRVPRQRLLFAVAAVLVGIDVVLIVTYPVHDFMWVVPQSTVPEGFATIEPAIGYWLHTQLLVLLFAGGAVLFAGAWRRGLKSSYTSGYTIAAVGVIAAIAASSVLSPGGSTVASIVAVSLTGIGWVQANRGRVLLRLRRSD